jgi:TolB-like protein
MNKLSTIFVAMLIGVAMMLAPATAMAQLDFGAALGAFLGAAQPQQQNTVSPYDAIRDNAPAKSKILGTWQYKSASLEYLGTPNPIADVALAQVEGIGISALQSRGVVEGCCSLTLRRNGMAILATRDTLQDGVMTYDEESAKVEFSTTVEGVTYTAKGYIRIVSDRLVVLLDARDAMNIVAKSTPSITSDQMFLTAKEVLKTVGDVYLAIAFVR